MKPNKYFKVGVKMKIIGLTGGIASGKSTASNILEKFGATIIDADVLSRKVVEKGQITLKEITESFGGDILREDGTLDRKKLGKIVFSDKKKLKKLNSIIHPAIHKLSEELFEIEKAKGIEKVIYDSPLLIEEHLMDRVDEVWLVYVDEKTQLERLIKRDGSSRKEAIDRIGSQLSLEEKKRYADVLINNNGSTKELEEQLREIWYEQ